MTVEAFRNIVWKHYEMQGRHSLPWRKTTNPYKILVSEIMLQQTQVERVIPFYRAWLKRFPTVHALAEAPLGDVLTQWQGLGYNRRAKMLHTAAQTIVQDYKGVMPRTVFELESLPGIGHYTARAVMAFAHNENVVFVETNLRTVVLYHFYPQVETTQESNANEMKVPDTDILAILEKALVKSRAREWYGALMDYGSYLKTSGVRTNHRAKGYTKQAKFEGSDRQVRGAILRALSSGPTSRTKLESILGPDRISQSIIQLEKLEKEGMIKRTRTRYCLP